MWATLISAGMSLAGGMAANSQAQDNAANSLAYSQHNASLSTIYGNYNRDVIIGTAIASATGLTRVADFNATIQEQVGEYNALLNEREADYILDAAEIDVTTVEKEVKRVMSGNRATYAAAGVQVNNPNDSPSVKQVDTATQGALDVAIIRHGAKIEANQYLDQAKMSRWQGITGAMLTRFGAEVDSSSILSAGYNQGNMAAFQGQVGAANQLWEGQVNAQNYSAQGSAALTSGLVGAASSVAGAWSAGKFSATTPTNLTPATHAINYGSNPGGVGTSPLSMYA